LDLDIAEAARDYGEKFGSSPIRRLRDRLKGLVLRLIPFAGRRKGEEEKKT
jgi:hypothetical protein